MGCACPGQDIPTVAEGRSLWTVNYSQYTLEHFTPELGTAELTFLGAGNTPTGLSIASGVVWVVTLGTPGTPKLFRVDATTNRVIAKMNLPPSIGSLGGRDRRRSRVGHRPPRRRGAENRGTPWRSEDAFARGGARRDQTNTGRSGAEGHRRRSRLRVGRELPRRHGLEDRPENQPRGHVRRGSGTPSTWQSGRGACGWRSTRREDPTPATSSLRGRTRSELANGVLRHGSVRGAIGIPLAPATPLAACVPISPLGATR